MQHLPYPKIRTSLPPGAPQSGLWVATEKVHGANLVVASDGRQVRFGKRKAWLNDGDAFFAWQLLRDALSQAILAISRHYPGQVVRLFGELYGGAYPHPDVPPVPGLTPVQSGVWYAPGLHFAPFDLMTHDGARFEGFEALEALCSSAGLTPPPVVGRGPLRELRRLPVRFASVVHSLHGLPPIAGNIAEGFVLKRAQGGPVGGRPTAKHKIPEFDEARFYQATAFDSGQRLDLEALQTVGQRMVNPMRLASARSKLGQVPQGELLDEVVLDVLVDLSEAYPAAMQGVDEAALTAHLRARAQEAVQRSAG